MKMRMAIFMFLASVMVCRVQAVNISGMVKNSEGSGIEGVLVRLGKTGIETTTVSDGSFRLLSNVTGIKHQTHHTAFGCNQPLLFEGERLFLNGAEPAEVKVSAYDCNGRLLFSRDKDASLQNHLMTLPHLGSGIHIYCVSLNDKHHVFKSVAALAINHTSALSWKGLNLAKQAKTTEQIEDALLFTKEGYQLFRLAVTKPDTSGIQVTMIPLVTGTVTDADGNVYQTVRIGNQEWTIENLRTTKYNDGTNVPLVTDNAAWSRLSGAGFCFYNNTTDAAAKKKWGALYNWAAVKTGKLAPTGWHVPTDAEWDTLQNCLIAHGYNYDGTTSGNKIAKSISTKTDWLTCEDSGAIGNDLSKNNASGFSILPAGYRYYDGIFADQMSFSHLWTATESDASFAWYRLLWTINPDLYRSDRVKSIGCSVRLVRHN